MRTTMSEGMVVAMADEAWRAILARCIEDPKEKRRIANLIGILSSRTLDRWAEGVSTPKNSQVIRKLSQVVSTSQQELDEALRTAFPDAFIPSRLNEPLSHLQNPITERGIPTEFVFRVLNAYSTIPLSLQHWTITNLVLEQMIHHLDPDSTGMGVVLARYIQTTIQIIDGGGNNLWDTRQLVSPKICVTELDATKSVIKTGIPQFIQVMPSNPLRELGELDLFLHWQEIKSLAIYPIQRCSQVAGALLICARWEDFFTNLRRKLIHGYAELYSLAFRDQDFH